MFRIIFSVFALVVLCGGSARGEEPIVRLYALDCGTIKVLQPNLFDTKDSYGDEALNLVSACYLIQHGDDYMVWDLGLPVGQENNAAFEFGLSETVLQSLGEIGLGASDIGKIGISHAHFDHIGQANVFKDAQLLIGKADYEDVFTDGERLPAFQNSPVLLSEWADGKNVIKVDGTYDVFGDGSVMMIPMPGHTSGHMALQINLPKRGPVILVGDLYHFRENFEQGRYPDFNLSPEDTVVSFERMKNLVESQKAWMVIQHDPEDFSKMPKFPEYLD